MLGAGTSVLLIVWAYEWMQSETIFLVLVTAIPVAGVLAATFGRQQTWLERIGVVGLLLGLVLLGATLWHQQANSQHVAHTGTRRRQVALHFAPEYPVTE